MNEPTSLRLPAAPRTARARLVSVVAAATTGI